MVTHEFSKPPSRRSDASLCFPFILMSIKKFIFTLSPPTPLGGWSVDQNDIELLTN